MIFFIRNENISIGSAKIPIGNLLFFIGSCFIGHYLFFIGSKRLKLVVKTQMRQPRSHHARQVYELVALLQTEMEERMRKSVFIGTRVQPRIFMNL